MTLNVFLHSADFTERTKILSRVQIFVYDWCRPSFTSRAIINVLCILGMKENHTYAQVKINIYVIQQELNEILTV